MKKIPYWFKEMIVLFIVSIIALIVDDFYGVLFLYFTLHWLYSLVRIGPMGEDIKAMSEQIDRLTQRNEALAKYAIELEEELEKTRSQNK